MQINFEVVKKLELTPHDIIFLQACHQNDGELNEYLMSFVGKCTNVTIDMVTVVKKNKAIKLSKKGREVIKMLHSPNQKNEDVIIADYLVNLYKNDEGKISCSKEKLANLISWLRGIIGIGPKEFVHLIKLYLQTEESQYNKRLDYIIYKPNSTYNGAISLKNGESRLYNWYNNNREDIDDQLTNI